MDPQKLKEEAPNTIKFSRKMKSMYTQAELDAAIQKKLKEETDKLAAAKPQDQPKATHT